MMSAVVASSKFLWWFITESQLISHKVAKAWVWWPAEHHRTHVFTMLPPLLTQSAQPRW
jgi:hypothetical protein